MSPTTATLPAVDATLDLDAWHRAWHGPSASAVVHAGQLTVTRQSSNDFQDRQVYLFVDDEPWGKVRYGRPLSREIAPGHHRVRAFNTLFSHTIEIDVAPGEHVRLRCSNGMPNTGWLLMVFLHVTFLLVKLEQEL